LSKTIFYLLLCFFCILSISWKNFTQVTKPIEDRLYYLKIAKGEQHEVISPFSKRVAHPLFAAAFSQIFKGDLRKSFQVISLLSLIVFLLAITLLYRRFQIAPPLILFTVSPYLVQIFYDYYMHDLFYGALLALFLVLFSRSILSSFIFIPLLFIVRESTLLVSLVLFFVLLREKKYRDILIILGATAIGIVLSNFFAHAGLPNRYGFSEIFYMGSKIIYNTSLNFFGIELWNSSMNSCTPKVIFNLPFLVGKINQIGYCAWHPINSLITLVQWLTIFGLLPSLLLKIKSRLSVVDSHKTIIYFCLIYGFLSFVLGPMIGPGGFRLTGYGWPCFWVAILALQKTISWPFFILNLFLTWVPPLTYYFLGWTHLAIWVVFCIAVITHLVFWLRVKNEF